MAVAITLVGLIIASRFLVANSGIADDPSAVNVKVQLEGFTDYAHLVANADGTFAYQLRSIDGSPVRLSPDEFARRLYRQQASRDFWEVLFNISGPVGLLWVGLGLVGQVLFTGRMIVQWLASERSHQSVVPPLFWWMSLVGALMLLAYFLWRRDVVGILGQSVGLGIYVRNLHLIYMARRSARRAAA